MTAFSKAQEHARAAKRRYAEGDYLGAVMDYDKAITLGDRSFQTYDGKAAAMSRAEHATGGTFSPLPTLAGPSRITGDSAAGPISTGLKSSAYQVAEKMCQTFAKDKLVYRAWYRKASILYSMKQYAWCLRALDHAQTLVTSTPGISVDDRAKGERFIDSLRKQAIVDQRKGRLNRMDAESARQRAVRTSSGASLDEGDSKRRKLDREQNRQMLEEEERLAYIKATTDYTHLLPRDLVVMICTTGMDWAGDEGMAVRMAGVNRSWREWVGTEVGLWQTLRVTEKKPITKTRLWMDRSKGRLRKLSIEQKFDIGHLPALRAELGEESAFNIRSFHAQHPDGNLIHRAFQAYFRSLESLICHPDSSAYSDTDALNILHKDASILNVISLHGQRGLRFPRPDATSDPKSPTFDRHLRQWLACRKISIANCTIAMPDTVHFGSGYILQRLRQAEDVEIDSIAAVPTVHDGAFLGTQSAGPEEEAVLDLLWRYVECRTQFTSCPPFQAISAPNLTHLTMWSVSYDVANQLAGKGLKLALPNLVHLEVGKSPVRTGAFIKLFSRLTALRYLGVSGCALNAGFFEALTRKDGEGEGLLPNLVALSTAGLEDISGSAIKDLVYSRLPVKLKQELKDAERRKAEKQKPTMRSAFAPTIKKTAPVIRQEPLLDTVTFLTVPAGPEPARLEWLNIDGCRHFEPQLVDVLRKRVKTVLWAGEAASEERLRGLGRYDWEADWGLDCDECQLRKLPGIEDKWYVHHMCGAKYEEGLFASQSTSRRRR